MTARPTIGLSSSFTASVRAPLTADFLICRRCGVFIAAISDIETAPSAEINVTCLDDRAFTALSATHEFEGETLEARTSRL
jgi:hypothetical protein